MSKSKRKRSTSRRARPLSTVSTPTSLSLGFAPPPPRDLVVRWLGMTTLKGPDRSMELAVEVMTLGTTIGTGNLQLAEHTAAALVRQMIEHNSALIPSIPSKTPLTGETWFVQLARGATVGAYEIDEVTRFTVAMRRVADLGDRPISADAQRYAIADVIFVEKLP